MCKLYLHTHTRVYIYIIIYYHTYIQVMNKYAATLEINQTLTFATSESCHQTNWCSGELSEPPGEEDEYHVFFPYGWLHHLHASDLYVLSSLPYSYWRSHIPRSSSRIGSNWPHEIQFISGVWHELREHGRDADNPIPIRGRRLYILLATWSGHGSSVFSCSVCNLFIAVALQSSSIHTFSKVGRSLRSLMVSPW